MSVAYCRKPRTLNDVPTLARIISLAQSSIDQPPTDGGHSRDSRIEDRNLEIQECHRANWDRRTEPAPARPGRFMRVWQFWQVSATGDTLQDRGERRRNFVEAYYLN